MFNLSKLFYSLVSLSLVLSYNADIDTRSSSFTHHVTKRASQKSCVVPTLTPERTFQIVNSNSETLQISSGTKVPIFSQLTQSCQQGYSLDNGDDTLESSCNLKGAWNPPLKPCLKRCAALHLENAGLAKCERAGKTVECNGVWVSGTRVYPKCKSLFHVKTPRDSPYIECKSNGRWNEPPIECISDCGRTKSNLLIANGQSAKLGDFPWHVGIYLTSKSDLLICGGTLISATIVISAAHCFYDQSTGRSLTHKSEDYRIVVAKVTRPYKTRDNTYQKEFKIKKIINSPKVYDPRTTNHYGSDIIAIILDEAVSLSMYVLPACLKWTDLEFDPGTQAKGLVAGWGYNENGIISTSLFYAKIPFVGYNECTKKVTGITPDKFCAGDITGPKPTNGDSGGGLVFQDPDNGLFYLRGIVSTADRYLLTSIVSFTDVSNFIGWIHEIYKHEDNSTSTNRSQIPPEPIEIPSFPNQTPTPVENSMKCTPNCITCNGKAWTIENNRNLPLNTWPLVCLTKSTDPSLDELVSRSSSSIFSAARRGYLGVVEYYVKKKNVPLVRKDGDGNTPLHIASEQGHLNLVKYLVENMHADIYIVNKKVRTALHLATMFGHLPVVKYFVEQCKMSPEQRDADYNTLISLASYVGKLNVIKYLADERKADVSVTNTWDSNLLHLSMYSKNLELVKYLVDDKKFSARINELENLGTAAMVAANEGDLVILKFLISDRHADVNISNKDGWNVLHFAANKGDLAMVKYLVEQVQMPTDSKTNDGSTAYDLAQKRQHIFVSKYLEP